MSERDERTERLWDEVSMAMADGLPVRRRLPRAVEATVREMMREIHRRLGSVESKLGRAGLKREQWERIHDLEAKYDHLCTVRDEDLQAQQEMERRVEGLEKMAHYHGGMDVEEGAPGGEMMDLMRAHAGVDPLAYRDPSRPPVKSCVRCGRSARIRDYNLCPECMKAMDEVAGTAAQDADRGGYKDAVLPELPTETDSKDRSKPAQADRTPHDSAVPDPRHESGLTYCRDCGDPLIACECEEEHTLQDAIDEIREVLDGDEADPEGMPEPDDWTMRRADGGGFVKEWLWGESTVRTLVQRAERAEREASRDGWVEAGGEIVRLRERVRELEDLRDRLKLEAEIHAGEARAANATIHEIYQAVTEGRGEPGTWNGAKPVREELDRLRERVRELEGEVDATQRLRRIDRDGFAGEKAALNQRIHNLEAQIDRTHHRAGELYDRAQPSTDAPPTSGVAGEIVDGARNLQLRIKELEEELAASRARPQVTDEAVEAAFASAKIDGAVGHPSEAMAVKQTFRNALEAALPHMTPRPGGGEPEPETHEPKKCQAETTVGGMRFHCLLPNGHDGWHDGSGRCAGREVRVSFDGPDQPTPDAPAPSEESVEGVTRYTEDDEVVGRGHFHLERMDDGHVWLNLGGEAFDLEAAGRIAIIPQTPVTITRTNPPEETDGE